MKGYSASAMIGMILLVVGGLNWGMVGLFNFDLVAWLFGAMTPVSRSVYVLVGIAAIGIAAWIPSWACSVMGSCMTDTTKKPV